MPSTARYDAMIVGGGLAGVAVATLLAKRGRHVALIEPRPEWGGRAPFHRVNGVSIPSGATLAVGFERTGRVDAYFESIGLSLGLLIRESSVMKRESVRTVWGDHRVTMASNRADFLEELRREYRIAEVDGEAMLAQMEASRRLLDPLFDPPISKADDSAWLRLRRRARARSFVARFGRLSLRDYATTRDWPDALGDYLEPWQRFLTPSSEARENWGASLYRLGLVLDGVVALPVGRAGVCGYLAARFEALGGHVVRGAVIAVGGGRRPFIEVDGRRLEGSVLIVNSRGMPGEEIGGGDPASMDSVVFAVPGDCVPDAMGRFLLIAGDGAFPDCAVIRLRFEEMGKDGLIVSCKANRDSGSRARRAERLAERLATLMPFSKGRLSYLGSASDLEVPDPIEPKAWNDSPWRLRRWGWAQAGRSPVWWLADGGSPWIDDAAPYRAALAVDHVVRIP